jgi:hypothetical protein
MSGEPSGKQVDRVRQGTQLEAELSEQELEQLAGGAAPRVDVAARPVPPAGPVPIPYPNVGK